MDASQYKDYVLVMTVHQIRQRQICRRALRTDHDRGQGDAVVHISAAALSSIEIMVPTFDEQTAIATILSDMDAEIAALETRLAKTRSLKQGMMHNLLTGKIRLV